MIIHGAPFTNYSYGWVTFHHKKRNVLTRYIKLLGAEHQYTEQDNSRLSRSYRFPNSTDYARIFYNEQFACWELHLSCEDVYKRTMRTYRKYCKGSLCKPLSK